MATNRSEKSRVQKWEGRIVSANKQYKEWSERYDTPRLEEYYLGRQWQGVGENDAKKKYVINLVFSTIETNKPSLIFYNPHVKIEPRPSKEDDMSSSARDRAVLCQDTVQTFVDDPNVDFLGETSLALHEAHFRFGMIEVGYTANWVDNPDAQRPMLKEKAKEDEPAEEMKDSKGDPVMQPDYVVKGEQLFVKRIPASTFRVSISNKNKMTRNDWVGYYEWMYVEDVKRDPLYKKGAIGLKATSSLLGDKQEERTDDDTADDVDRHSGMVKVWKIWDLRSRLRHVIAEGHDRFLLEGDSDAEEDDPAAPWKFLPLSFIKFYDVLDSFYPCPPVYQWLGPQDEVNETRDAQRAHRRRFYRRYTRINGAIDDEELEKLETGGDGVTAISNMPNPLTPVPDAPMSSDVWRHLDESKTDFLTVSGVSGDQRGVAESETATQAQIINQHAQLRESSIRTKVQEWLADICRLILLTIRQDMALPFWVKRNVDLATVSANNGEEIMRIANLWNEVGVEELGDSAMQVTIDLSSMSPVAQESEKQSWIQVLGLITKPDLAMLLAMSPTLLRKTLSLFGVRNQSEIAEIQQVLQQMMMMQAAQAQAAGAGSPGAEVGGNNGITTTQTPAEMGGEVLQ